MKISPIYIMWQNSSIGRQGPVSRKANMGHPSLAPCLGSEVHGIHSSWGSETWHPSWHPEHFSFPLSEGKYGLFLPWLRRETWHPFLPDIFQCWVVLLFCWEPLDSGFKRVLKIDLLLFILFFILQRPRQCVKVFEKKNSWFSEC